MSSEVIIQISRKLGVEAEEPHEHPAGRDGRQGASEMATEKAAAREEAEARRKSSARATIAPVPLRSVRPRPRTCRTPRFCTTVLPPAWLGGSLSAAAVVLTARARDHAAAFASAASSGDRGPGGPGGGCPTFGPGGGRPSFGGPVAVRWFGRWRRWSRWRRRLRRPWWSRWRWWWRIQQPGGAGGGGGTLAPEPARGFGRGRAEPPSRPQEEEELGRREAGRGERPQDSREPDTRAASASTAGATRTARSDRRTEGAEGGRVHHRRRAGEHDGREAAGSHHDLYAHGAHGDAQPRPDKDP